LVCWGLETEKDEHSLDLRVFLNHFLLMYRFTITAILSLAACFAGIPAAQAQAVPVVPSAKAFQMPAGTTQEEYNYATKGLKIQRATGLDTKAGYVLTNPTSMHVGSFTVTLEDLLRSASGTVACTVLQVSDYPATAQGGTAYFCIPNPGSGGEIWAQFNQSQQVISSAGLLRAVTYSLAARLSAMTTAVTAATHKP